MLHDISNFDQKGMNNFESVFCPCTIMFIILDVWKRDYEKIDQFLTKVSKVVIGNQTHRS